ncbi:TIGR03089 family protein [Tessaracoccus antarcticus]|uniref:TIGR03089 family protein n=1 Tax=Tessaracoccus antarcticus TaxID=2479848 RepID=A0A3M0GBK3_9ACTN|nr:TIGR03089 family protein [Tessaracoccus antarcticus]RMB62274.1 TIGR03089 family protein [Tessaracoccus antarcticus]
MAISALRRRLDALPSQPFYTHYEGDARIELSAVTFANWVDKTCNMLEDMGVDPTEVVQLDLARSHPGHWVTMVWVAACWQRGCTVSLDADPTAVMVVTGPDAVADTRMTVACSLHPLGLGFPVAPVGCTDYAEVLSQPDSHVAEPLSPHDVAVAPDTTFQHLREVAPRSGRLLAADPVPGWESIRDLLVAPLLGNGSTVVVVGADEDAVERIRTQERVEAG